MMSHTPSIRNTNLIGKRVCWASGKAFPCGLTSVTVTRLFFRKKSWKFEFAETDIIHPCKALIEYNLIKFKYQRAWPITVLDLQRELDED